MSILVSRLVSKYLPMWLRAALAVFVASVFPGCATVNPDIGDMTRAYSDAIERHEMNQILRNLLRAADGLPMRFQAMPTIVGTGLLESNVGISGKVLGGFLDSATTNPSLKSSRGFNFSLASLDNERFTNAFVGDLSLDTINVISSGNFQRQLLFTLALQSISFNGGPLGERHIDNVAFSPEGFSRFQSALSDLIAAGLRTETYHRLTPIGVDISREELLERYLGSRLALESAVRTVRINTPSGPSYRLVRRERAVRLCLSPEDYRKLTGLKVNRWLACREPGLDMLTEATRPTRDAESDYEIHLNIRSTRDVYKYVGLLVKAQLKAPNHVPSIVVLGEHSGVSPGTYPIIVVRKGDPRPGEKILAIAEHQGETYYVPREDSGLSAQVFDSLSLLLSASMVKDSIPASPGILVR